MQLQVIYKKTILNIETYRFKLKLHREMYYANTNEKKAGVRFTESDTVEQLSIRTATTKSKKMKTLKPNHYNL